MTWTGRTPLSHQREYDDCGN